MWPVQSMWNQYSACRSLIGRDSMRVRSMPRTASSVSRPSSVPGRFWVVAANVVRSWPVGAGSGPGGATRANRVTAPAVVGHVVGQRHQPVLDAGDRGGDGRVHLAAGHLGGRLGGRGGLPDLGGRQVRGDPVPGLRDAVGVRGDGAHVADRRSRAGPAPRTGRPRSPPGRSPAAGPAAGRPAPRAPRPRRSSRSARSRRRPRPRAPRPAPPGCRRRAPAPPRTTPAATAAPAR